MDGVGLFVSRAVTSWWLGAAMCLGLGCTFTPKVDSDALVRHGQYMVKIAGCDDCHSPKVFTEKGPEVDASRRLSGHPAGSPLPEVPRDVLGPTQWGAVTTNDMTAWAGPWGISFASNLTPHHDGLGLWTEEQFIKTLRTGLHLGVGRPVLPPMPWPAYSNMTDDDLRAMFAFLKTLPPIANTVPQPVPPDSAPGATPEP
jgi:hypothetical protein